MLRLEIMENTLPSLSVQAKLFFTNPCVLSCLFGWLGAQFIKTAINLIRGRIHSIGELIDWLLWRTGGMPSSHSSMCSALATTIGFRNGFNSDIFIFALMFLMMTVRDALGVRRSSGLQAKKINELGSELQEKKAISLYKKLKEVNGHSPMEVICGVILGIFIGVAFGLLK